MLIQIPNLGDGISSATVLSILIKPGDTIQKGQTILELETDKATAPIPASAGGVVAQILVKEGDTVTAGSSVASLNVTGSSDSTHGVSAPPVSAPLVSTHSTPEISKSQEAYRYVSQSGFPPPASPTLRRIADELGIDLTVVRGSESGGRIVMKDLKAYIQNLKDKAVQSPNTAPMASPSTVALPDFSKWGPITSKPVSSLRKKMGQKMADSWKTIPHVTQFEEADVSHLMALRKKYAPKYEKKGGKLTLTVLALKAVVATLQKFPVFNSSYDEAAGVLISKSYYHIGVAVDTENGLIVPVIKDVDQKSVIDLCLELQILAEKARKRQISLEDLQGGTFTLSNLGGLGASYFTPIINAPEVAILALSKGVEKPLWQDGKWMPTLMLPLGVSYDHRVIDGADGARFCRELVHQFESFDEAILKI